MDTRVKEFIEKYIYLLDCNDWEEFYKHVKDESRDYTLISRCSEVFINADINPAEYLSEIPTNFLRSSSIQVFMIPDNVKMIDICAFCDCQQLSKISIPGTVKLIESSAFSGCENLVEVILAEGLERIESYAFGHCEKLASLDIPKSVNYIADTAFDRCKKLVINYPGMKEDWYKLYANEDNTRAYTESNFIVHCLDGDIISKIKKRR